ncbi:MAG: hypothetical protein M1831_001869 [Alyxoria varia]|nr:MAG: hypothetical protein M1831_001869 [Alyxoria varia]
MASESNEMELTQEQKLTMLNRSSQLALTIFLRMRRGLYKPEITSVKYEDGRVITTFVEWPKDGVFCSFPEPVVEDSNKRSQLLLAGAHEESIRSMYQITKRVLLAISEDVCEVTIKINEEPKQFVHHGEKATFPVDHRAIKLSIGDETYIWDLTAIQFGAETPVLTLKQFNDLLKSPTIEGPHEFGRLWKGSGNLVWLGFEAQEKYMYAYKVMGNLLGKAIAWWEAFHITLNEALLLGSDRWSLERASLLQKVQDDCIDIMMLAFHDDDADFIREGRLSKIRDYKDPTEAVRAAHPDITGDGDIKMVLFTGPPPSAEDTESHERPEASGSRVSEAEQGQ